MIQNHITGPKFFGDKGSREVGGGVVGKVDTWTMFELVLSLV